MTSDRRRDREAAAHGWVLLRFTWDDILDRPYEIVSSVKNLLRDRRVAV
jgi:very-short-patch-repair endonuclease